LKLSCVGGRVTGPGNWMQVCGEFYVGFVAVSTN
jgi:hypothetical protein